jgi:hypothetical protein
MESKFIDPPEKEKLTAKSRVEQHQGGAPHQGPVPLDMPIAAVSGNFKPNPPAGFTALRTITITVYGAAGQAPMFYLVEGSYNGFHSSEMGLAQDLRNRLHPPYATVN